MSSNYHVLCLSHDPAITLTSFGYNRPEEAEAAVRDDTDSHALCDLLIARHSGALIELGCPPSYPAREGAYRCGTHGRTEWVDVEWLRLLAAAYQSDDEAVRSATAERGFCCWPWDRLRRLRVELGITVAVPAPGAGVAAAETGAVCEAYRPPATSDDSGLCARCGMFDYKHSEKANA